MSVKHKKKKIVYKKNQKQEKVKNEESIEFCDLIDSVIDDLENDRLYTEDEIEDVWKSFESEWSINMSPDDIKQTNPMKTLKKKVKKK